jgi:hypothetical protein
VIQSPTIFPVSWPANAGHPGDIEIGAAKRVDIFFFEFSAGPTWVARTPAGHDISC